MSESLELSGVLLPEVDGDSFWVPYLKSIKFESKSKWLVEYKGGSFLLNMVKVRTIMFYGRAGEIPVSFLLDAAKNSITVIIHSSRSRKPLVFMQHPRAGTPDILTCQIKFRANERKKLVIAKALVHARLLQMGWLMVSAKENAIAALKAGSLKDLRLIEARASQRYWSKYYQRMGRSGLGRRDDHDDVNKAINACISLLISKIMRWIVFHRLSPCHGFLHEPTTYEALAYDMIEPCRHWIEMSVLNVALKNDELEGSLFIAKSINAFKSSLNEWVEVPSLQVKAKRKSIIHGHILALRSYLIGDGRKLNLPIDTLERCSGRPVKVTYRIPGSKSRNR